MNMILRALMVSVWFMALTFPLVVLKVDALNDTILFRWENMAALRCSPARLRPSGSPSPAIPASASSQS